MAPINVGFIGYGFSTKCFHLPFILPNPDLKIYAFLQRAAAPAAISNPEKGKHCTIDYPSAKHYQTADEFFADDEIELVLVCSQHDSHAEFAERALAAGKHGTPYALTEILGRDEGYQLMLQKWWLRNRLQSVRRKQIAS